MQLLAVQLSNILKCGISVWTPVSILLPLGRKWESDGKMTFSIFIHSWRFGRLRGKRRMKALSCVCYLGCDVNKDEIIVLFKSQLFGVLLALTVSTSCVSDSTCSL